MTDRFKYLKLFVENWKTVSSIGLLLLSLIGVGADNYDERTRKEAAQLQVAEVAKQYAAEFKPNIVIHQKGDKCSVCLKKLNTHIKDFEKIKRKFH